MQTVQNKGSFDRAARRGHRRRRVCVQPGSAGSHINSLQQLVTEVHRALRLQPRLQRSGSSKASGSAMRPPHTAA